MHIRETSCGADIMFGLRSWEKVTWWRQAVSIALTTSGKLLGFSIPGGQPLHSPVALLPAYNASIFKALKTHVR